MARTHYQGPRVGNYVTYQLINKIAVGAEAALVDSLPLMHSFRVSHICVDADTAAQAGTVTAHIRHRNSGFANSGNLSLSATPPNEAFANDAWSDDRDRNFWIDKLNKGGSVADPATNVGDEIFYFITAGTSSAKGSSCMWVTGFHTDHPYGNQGLFRESGQGQWGGPVSGHYCIVPLINLIALAGDETVSTCAFTVPFANARVMGIDYDYRGITVVGTPTVVVKKNTLPLHTVLPITADGSDRVDQDETPTFVTSGVRDVTRGQTLNLEIDSDASDVFPINSVSAHVWLWVQGHVMADSDND